MRLLKASVADYGFGMRTYYEEKETNCIRGNTGFVLPKDAILMRIGTNISKYEHHIEIAQMITDEQREEHEVNPK